MKRQLFLVIWVALAILIQSNLSSCKKSDPPNLEEQEALLMDSTYYFSLAYSLWNTDLPQPRVISGNKLDLRRFTRNYSNAEEVLDALVKYMPLDRFSFIDRQGQVSDEIGQGLHRDIGVSPQFMFLGSSSSEVGLFIRLVQKNSPAEHVGLNRGLQIVAVDGTGISFTANSNGQVQGDLVAYNKIMSGDIRSLGVRNWETGQVYAVDIPNTGSYIIDPFVAKDVFTVQGKRVGYLAYDSFVSVRDPITGLPTRYYEAMKDAFSDLGIIHELIIDFRYNGGGAGNAAELMTNIIAPSSANGQMMYKYVINNILSEAGFDNEDLPNAPFVPEYINKSGLPNLNLSRVYFLVTERTASASEMVINCLKPYVDVKIISAGEGTYGKPVGSFQQTVLNGYADLYITSFKTVNKNGEGDYFNGIEAHRKNIRDELDKQLGDPQENLLRQALHHIETDNYPATAQRSNRASSGLRGSEGTLPTEALNVPQLEPSIQGLFIFDKINVN